MNRIVLTIIITLSVVSLSIGEPVQNSFGIYLIEKDAPDLNNVLLSRTATITDADIIEYNWTSHSIILTDKAFQTVKMNERQLYQKKFVVVANEVKCYRGAFWSSISSVSHPNPIINLMPIVKQKKNEIVIERAYPSADFAGNKAHDPRGDKRIYNVLSQLRKLK